MAVNLYLTFLGLCMFYVQSAGCAESPENDSTDVKLLLKRIEDLEKREKRNEEINKNQEHEIHQLKTQIEQNRVNLDHTFKQRQLDNETPVAFYGKMTNTVNVTNQILKFDTIVTNIGNAYQRSTGRIIVPISGIYVFSLTAMAELNTDTHLGIYVNDKRMTNLKLNGPEQTYDTMTQTAVYYLHQYENVSVQHHEGTKAIHSDYTAFTAFLLQQDYGQIASNILG